MGARRATCVATLAAASFLTLASPSPAAPTFTSNPARPYTGDPARGMVPETRPDDIRDEWRVETTVEPPWCDAAGRYTWSVDGRRADVERRGPCAFELTFAAPGTHRVTLSARIGAQAATATRDVEVKGRLIVVMGDSIASGEGVPDIPGRGKGPQWQSPRCHRSARAAPALAAALLQERDPQTAVTLVSVACSGAKIDRGLLHEYKGIAQRRRRPLLAAQTDELDKIERRSGRHVDAVVISIGANDIGFSSVLKRCALHLPNCLKRTAAALGRLSSGYELLDQKLRQLRIPPSRVYLMQYFNPTLARRGARCSGKVLHISATALANVTDDVLEPLNHAGEEAATQYKWNYVRGIDRLFEDHGYCVGRAETWVVKFTHSLAGERRLAGTMHPNAEGHRQIAQVLARALDRKPHSPCDDPGHPCQPTSQDEQVSQGVADGLVAGGGLVAVLLSGVFVQRNAVRWRRTRT